MDKTDIVRERVKPVEVGDHVPVPLNILEHWQHKIMVGFRQWKAGFSLTRGGGHDLSVMSPKNFKETACPHC